MLKQQFRVGQALLVCVILAGCAAPQTRTPTVNNESASEEAKKQQTLVAEDYVNNYQRLQAVTSRVVTNGTDLCAEKVAGYYGFDFWNQDSVDKSLKEATKARYNLGEAYSVLSVAADSPAAKAGMKEGDVLVSLNDWLIPIGKESEKQLNLKLTEYGKDLTPVQFTVARNGENQKLSLTPVKACDFKVHLIPDEVKNAFADGKSIYINKGMMDFFKTDEEIALVVSHELAHNAMKHIDAKEKNAMVGGFFGLLLDVAAAAAGVNTNGDFTRLAAGIAGNTYSVEFEQEADYVGLYFMEKAHYNISDAAAFWRRMAVSNSQAITIKTSHPTTPERFLALETAVAEIKGKVAKGEPLKPELKASNKPEAAATTSTGDLPEIAPQAEEALPPI